MSGEDNPTCTYTEGEETYEFFNYADKNIPYDVLNKDYTSTISSSSFCNLSKNDIQDNLSEFTGVCKIFEQLIKSLFDGKPENVVNYSSRSEYMNYWLNNEIKKINGNSICVKNFYRIIMSKNNGNAVLRQLSNKIHDIKYNELDKMNILNKLYKEYYEINRLLKTENPDEEKCRNHATSCIQIYKQGEHKCTGTEPKFCKELSNFKDKYGKIDLCAYQIEGWADKKIPPLTKDQRVPLQDCERKTIMLQVKKPQGHDSLPDDIQDTTDTNVKTMIIGVFVFLGISFILFTLYKFTAFGSYLQSGIRSKKIVKDNLTDNMNELIHTSGYEHLNSEDISYNITYNSVNIP
ncbi:PIR Superfamily Protein [Plasmodium ovale curtisi]|uniref:PIR Superfamily Protein n=1 Tax=Plasmodium ovale curtisi TaxID=864141 RepID=A0A1A8WCZ2_PLAOA|nr:PIR Superfamily Protein [Plasmodium ovale curtisi]SBT02442.1 PIR Superfamily Protein [Plasmodium ovale curtisi]